MLRRSFLQTSLLAAGGISLRNKFPFSMFDIDPWNIRMLTDNAGVFTERGGTIGFHFSREGITVIDAEFPDTAAHLIAALKQRNNGPFRLLINTHHHRDHTSGNIAFRDCTARVLAHENSLKNQKNVAVQNKIEDQQYYPNNTFSSTWEEKAGKERIALYYFGAGHTDGDAMVHLQHADIVHMGDLVFNRRHPFVDRTAGASMKSWMTVLERAMKQFGSKTTFIFGHAADGYDVTGTLSDLSAFHDYLGNVLQYVGDAIRSGKTKEEILKTTTIPGSPEWKGDGIDRPLQAAYEELGSSS